MDISGPLQDLCNGNFMMISPVKGAEARNAVVIEPVPGRYMPLREHGILTERGRAWEMYERGHWTLLEYTEFCDKQGLLIF